jgi:hypothetical protein
MAGNDEGALNLFLKIIGRLMVAALATLVLLYGGDYAVAKRGVARNQSAWTESVKVQPMYIIPHKDSKAEYVFGEPQMVTCLHSIFPHFGYSPCWYVKKNAQPAVPMIIVIR